jgi:adrenodoxin-NADP+ reductase
MRLPSVAFHPIDASLIPDDVKSLPRAPRRLMDILLKGSPTPVSSPAAKKSWSLDFLLTPTEFRASPTDPSRLASTQFERTSLSSNFDPKAYALPTGATVQLPSSVAFRSIGYQSEPLPEFSSLGIPFNERWGVISNDGRGRVLHEERSRGAAMEMGTFPGLYCAGWVKRGPTGVIASTMEDAFSTADAIAEDWGRAEVKFLNDVSDHAEGKEGVLLGGWEEVRRETGVSKARVVDWEGWRRIDAAEREGGRKVGKEREKFTRTADMLAVLG